MSPAPRYNTCFLWEEVAQVGSGRCKARCSEAVCKQTMECGGRKHFDGYSRCLFVGADGLLSWLVVVGGHRVEIADLDDDDDR